MIISRQKEFKEILNILREKDIFIIGCGKCATKLHVGGEPEVLEIKKKLIREGKNIVGWTVLSSACNVDSWEEVMASSPAIEDAGALLIMSCAGGVSVISRISGENVYPGLETASLGGICREEVMKDQCIMCGECSIWMFGGICPLGQCAKGLLNGPCGGAQEGKCEVNDSDCVWDAIHERLRSLGRLEYLEYINEPKDHSRKSRREKA